MSESLIAAIAALIQIAVAVVALRAMRQASQRLAWILFTVCAGLLLAESLLRLVGAPQILNPLFSLLASLALLAALITLPKSLRSQVERRHKAQSQGRTNSMLELARRAMGRTELQSVRELACSVAAKAIGADSVLLLEREPGLHSFTVTAQDGWRSPPSEVRLSAEDPVISLLLTGSEPRVWQAEQPGQKGILTEMLTRDEAAVVAGVAIAGPMDPAGILIVHRRNSRLFTPDDEKVLSRLANMLAFARQSRSQRGDVKSFDHMRQGTTALAFCFDRLETVTFMNNTGQELLGFTPQQQAGLTLQKLFPEWALKRMRQEAIPRATETGFWNGEASVRSRAGREIALYQVLLAHRKNKGEIDFFSCFAYDLSRFPLPSARKMADSELRNRVRALENQLEEARKDTEAFAESTGRRLREPLGAISSFCKTLLNRHVGEMSSQVKRYMQLVSKANASAGQITIRLNQVARLARHPMNVRQIDMGKLAQAAWNELTAEDEEEQAQLRMRTLFPVTGDEAMLRRVLKNLLSNSIKYTSTVEFPEIEVGSRAEGSRYIYYVRDNGIGFDMEDLDKLFGLFQKLHKGEEDEGAGMGLYEVRHIVQRHGGEVWAQGGSGLGATIYFSLPSSQAA